MSVGQVLERYAEILRDFMGGGGEESLLRAHLLGRELVLWEVPPEEVAAVHEEALLGLLSDDRPRAGAELIEASSGPMMELLMAYGLAFRERLELLAAAESALGQKARVLRTTTDALSTFLRTRNWRAAGERLLGGALAMSESSLGSMGVVLEGPVLRILAYRGLGESLVAEQILDPEALRKYQECGHLDFWDLENLYGVAIRTGEPVLTNDPARHPNARGIPEGHPELSSLLALPVTSGDRIVGLLALANREAGYTGDDIQGLAPVVQAAGVLFDAYLHERREETLERQLLQSQKLESLGVLAGGIAHDFNNILGGIRGFTRLAMRETAEGSRIRSDLDKVLVASQRAMDLVSQIMTFSRLNDQDRRPILIAEVVREAVRLLRSTVPARIELSTELEEGPLHVLADSTRIHQVVMNLCSNAAESIGAGAGCIEVRLTQLQPEAPGEARRVELVVQDDGPGIPPEVMPRLFDPFFTTKQPGQGTGLGLSVVHGIVESHGGTITASNTPGLGACFRICLPLTEDLPRLARGTSTEEEIGGTERIVVVDDEVFLLEVRRRCLEDLGYQVATFEDPQEALAYLKASGSEVDLLIADYNMPRMTGLELVRQVLEAHPELPILICSGSPEFLRERAEANCLTAGYLRKPVDPEDLAVNVRRTLDAVSRGA